MNIFTIVKEHVSILDVIGEYTTLKKAGTYWKACCPFHNEKTASFTVSPHKEIFYCFGCHASGDVISFIATIERCSQHEAALFLADRHRIELPKSLSTNSPESSIQKSHYFELCSLVAQWAHEQLPKHAPVLHYIHNRGITMQSIDQFTLGYFPGGLQSIKQFIDYMKQQNILPHDLVTAHILAQGKTVFYSPFEDRIIFPIKDHLGRLCGFGGRTYKQHDTRPKYYNSHENEYFNKGTLLFGLDIAKKNIQQTGIVFLVEGYFDCIAMSQHGYTNTVATLGTACTVSHLRQLSRYAQQVYVLYDSDTAGHQAILRLTELCWQSNMELSVVLLPRGQDPASYLADKHNLKPAITQAQDIFLFFIDSLGGGFSNKLLHEKVALTRKVIEIIGTIDDELKQDILLQKAAKTFDIPYPALKRELERLPSSPPSDSLASISPVPPDPVHNLEKKIFCAIFNNIQLFNKIHEKYLIEYMPNPLRDVVKKLGTLYTKQIDTIDIAQFFTLLQEDEQRYVCRLLLEHDEEPISYDIFEHLLLQLHKKQWKSIVHDIKIKLTHAHKEGDDQKVQKIMHDFIALQHKIKAIVTAPKNKTS